jgi:hypothetical protein
MLKFMLDRSSFEKLYLSFIRPQLEYGDVVWDPHNKFLVNIWQRKRIVMSGIVCVHILKAVEDAGVMSFCILRLKLHIIIYSNVQNILVNEIFFFESYFSYWTFELRKIDYYLAALTYNTRHNNALPLPRTRKSLYTSYFISSTLKIMEFYTARNKKLPIP